MKRLRIRRLTAFFLVMTLLSACALPALAQEAEIEAERDLSPLPEDWFDDAVFMGDSISLSLGAYCDSEGGLGDALFLCEYSYGISNACSGQIKIWYQGQEYFAEDVLPLTGAKKLFIMCGVNDIGLPAGIDYAMERWEEFVTRVKEKNPELRIFVESMLPVWHDLHYYGLNNSNVLIYNDRLLSFCEEKGLVFVDIDDYFRDETGGLAYDYNLDFYVHLSPLGAQLWVEQLKNPANYSVDPRQD